MILGLGAVTPTPPLPPTGVESRRLLCDGPSAVTPATSPSENSSSRNAVVSVSAMLATSKRSKSSLSDGEDVYDVSDASGLREGHGGAKVK